MLAIFPVTLGATWHPWQNLTADYNCREELQNNPLYQCTCTEEQLDNPLTPCGIAVPVHTPFESHSPVKYGCGRNADVLPHPAYKYRACALKDSASLRSQQDACDRMLAGGVDCGPFACIAIQHEDNWYAACDSQVFTTDRSVWPYGECHTREEKETILPSKLPQKENCTTESFAGSFVETPTVKLLPSPPHKIRVQLASWKLNVVPETITDENTVEYIEYSVFALQTPNAARKFVERALRPDAALEVYANSLQTPGDHAFRNSERSLQDLYEDTDDFYASASTWHSIKLGRQWVEERDWWRHGRLRGGNRYPQHLDTRSEIPPAKEGNIYELEPGYDTGFLSFPDQFYKYAVWDDARPPEEQNFLSNGTVLPAETLFGSAVTYAISFYMNVDWWDRVGGSYTRQRVAGQFSIPVEVCSDGIVIPVGGTCCQELKQAFRSRGCCTTELDADVTEEEYVFAPSTSIDFASTLDDIPPGHPLRNTLQASTFRGTLRSDPTCSEMKQTYEAQCCW